MTLPSDLGAKPLVNTFPRVVLETGDESGLLSGADPAAKLTLEMGKLRPAAEARSAGSRPPTSEPPLQYSRRADNRSNGLASRTSTPVRRSTEDELDRHQFSSLDNSVSLDCPKGKVFSGLLKFKPSAFGTLSTQWLPKLTSSESEKVNSGGFNNSSLNRWPLKREPFGLHESLNLLNHGHRSIFFIQR